MTATVGGRPGTAHPGRVVRAVLGDPVLASLQRSELVRLLLTAAAGLQAGTPMPSARPAVREPDPPTLPGVPGSAPSPSEPCRPDLSRREQDVLRLYAANLPSKSVARQLGITEASVKEYLKRIRRKYASLGRVAGTKLDLYHRAREDGLVPGDTSGTRRPRGPDPLAVPGQHRG